MRLLRCAFVTPHVLGRVLPVMHLNAPLRQLFAASLVRDVTHYALMRGLRPASVSALLDGVPEAAI